MFIIGGIIGCVPFGVWVGVKQTYKAAISVICLGATAFATLEYFFFGIGPDHVWVVNLLCFGQGFVSLPIMSVAFDFGVEITYPIDASFSTGLLMNASQIVGIGFILLCSLLLDNYDTKHAGSAEGASICFLILAGASTLGLIASFLVVSDLRRFNSERI